MKKCFKCGIEKSLSEFYKHPQMLDGHLNKCKDCNRMDAKKDYQRKSANKNWIESERTRGRQKYRRLYIGTGKANPVAVAKWQEKFPEKIKATSSARRLKKPFANVENHHWSYNEEHFKDVLWLTKKEHMKAHRFLIYDQERKMYRRFDTNELLDTKERHGKFIIWCIKNKED